MINVYQPTLGKEELDALEKVFESNWLGKGKRFLPCIFWIFSKATKLSCQLSVLWVQEMLFAPVEQN